MDCVICEIIILEVINMNYSYLIIKKMIIEKWFRMGNFGLDDEDGRVGRGVF